jgi:hypothetical protein
MTIRAKTKDKDKDKDKDKAKTKITKIEELIKMFKEKRKKVFAKTALIIAMIFALTQSSWAVMSFNNNATTLKSGISSSAITDMNTTEVKKTEEQINLNNVIRVTNSAAKINMSLRKSDAQQVLRMLADKAKLNIIFYKEAVKISCNP